MSNPQRFRICSDDSGHDYFIPVGHVRDFEAWVEATENGGDTDLDFDANRIDGRFTFTNPRCDR